MDNRSFKIVDRLEGSILRDWLDLAMQDEKVHGHLLEPATTDRTARLVFFKHSPGDKPGYSPFLYSLGADQVALLVEGWLGSVEYPEKGSGDAWLRPGFILLTGYWEHVDRHGSGSWFEVGPVWALIGK